MSVGGVKGGGAEPQEWAVDVAAQKEAAEVAEVSAPPPEAEAAPLAEAPADAAPVAESTAPPADHALGATVIQGRLEEGRSLLASPPVSPEQVVAGLQALPGPALQQVMTEIAGLEVRLAEVAAQVTSAPAERAADSGATAGASAAEGSGSAAEGGAGAAAGASAGGAAGASSGAGAGGGGRVASEGPIKRQDEQGRASINYTANVADIAAEQARLVEVEALGQTVSDPSAGYAERFDAAIRLADEAIASLEAEVREVAGPT